MLRRRSRFWRKLHGIRPIIHSTQPPPSIIETLQERTHAPRSDATYALLPARPLFSLHKITNLIDVTGSLWLKVFARNGIGFHTHTRTRAHIPHDEYGVAQCLSNTCRRESLVKGVMLVPTMDISSDSSSCLLCFKANVSYRIRDLLKSIGSWMSCAIARPPHSDHFPHISASSYTRLSYGFTNMFLVSDKVYARLRSSFHCFIDQDMIKIGTCSLPLNTLYRTT